MAPTAMPSSGGAVEPSAAPADGTSTAAFPLVDEGGLRTLLQASGAVGVACDIDETLSWTVLWWMHEMQDRFGNPEQLTPAEMSHKYHLTQKVPYWAGRPEVEAWQQQQRENDELQTQLPLVAGALEGAVELHGIVPIVAYITIRPQAVLQGTRVWLRAHGFPDAPILGKPDAVPFSGGNAWKGALLPRLLPQVLGIVDDNPAVLSAVPPDYGGTVLLFLGKPETIDAISQQRRQANGESEGAGVGTFAVPCPDWPAVVAAARARLAPLLLPPQLA